MQFDEYEIVENKLEVPDVFVLRVKPKNQAKVFDYKAGQFCQIRNPNDTNPNEPHSFSIASSPHTKQYLEFCYKVYGNWTKILSGEKIGEMLQIFGPLGKFTWEDTIQHAVFLAGGVGIVPMLSILRYNLAQNITTPVTVIYGNRTEGDIAYRDELAYLISKSPDSSIVNVLSAVKDTDSWGGYRGFVTKEILEKEVDFTKNQMFFLCGPPIFVQLMKDLLKRCNVPQESTKQELFSFHVKPEEKTALQQ